MRLPKIWLSKIILMIAILSGCSESNANQNSNNNSQTTALIRDVKSIDLALKNWMVLFVRMKPGAIYQYYPYTGKLLKTSLNQDLIECIGVNARLHSILCYYSLKRLNALINYKTGKVVQLDIPYLGPISSDGQYVIDNDGRGIYDLKNKKIISYFPKKNDKLFTEGGIAYSKSVNIGHKKFPYHQLFDNQYLTFSYPTIPKPDGRFLAFRLSAPGGNTSTKNLYEYNLYDIIKRKGRYFQAIKRADMGEQLDINWASNYVAKQFYLLGKTSSNGQVSVWIKKRERVGPRKGTFIGDVSNDGSWAVIYPRGKNKKFTPAIYNVKQRRIEVANIAKQGVPTKPWNVFWVWIGGPENHPAYVD